MTDLPDYLAQCPEIVIHDEGRKNTGSFDIGLPVCPLWPVAVATRPAGKCWFLKECTLSSPPRELTHRLAEIEVQRSPWRSDHPAIFRAQEKIRDVDHENFEPKIISFGPYHNGKLSLEAMENIKLQYLKRFLLRKPDLQLDLCVKKVMDMEKQTRSSYSEVVKMKSHEFAKMMLLDGCFIVEFLVGWFKEQSSKPHHIPEEWTLSDNSESMGLLVDQISCRRLNLRQIYSDLLLLENQVPFFLIQMLYELIYPGGNVCPIAICFLCSIYDYLTLFPLRKKLKNNYLSNIFECGFDIKQKPQHLLHLLLMLVQDPSCSLSTKQNNLPSSRYNSTCSSTADHSIRDTIRGSNISRLHGSNNRTSGVESLERSVENLFNEFLRLRTEDSLHHKTIPSATELREAGVKFMAKEEPNGLIDVAFEDGTMLIPKLYIFKSAPLLLWNLVAFEQCCIGTVGTKVSTYIMFMSCLISTANDVMILKRKEVIRHSLGNDDTVTVLFHRISREVRMKYLEQDLLHVIDNVNKHNNASKNKWWTKLRRDYFGNPWSVISLVAAFLLLIISIGGFALAVVRFSCR